LNQYRDASNRLTFDYYSIDSKFYSTITAELVKKFRLKPMGKLIVGLDEIFQEYRQDNCIIGLEWDIWSGYIVVAKESNSEHLAKEIAEYISGKY